MLWVLIWIAMSIPAGVVLGKAIKRLGNAP
ncbi:hypothetical protein [Caulobacter phage ERS]|nr:hypothetical protein [Caulobacter phage ERS]